MTRAGTAARLFLLQTVLIDAIGIGLVFPVMPDLLEGLTGEGLAGAALWGGVLGTAYAAMQFLFGPVVGNLSDAYGRRPVMLTALAVMSLDYAVTALAGTIWLLVAGRVVAGITAASHATAAAAMADISAPEEKGRNFGLIGAAFGVGFTLGPMLGSVMSIYGVRAPFWAAAALAAANAIFGWFAFPETLRERRALDWRRANPLGAFAAVGRLPGLRPLLAVYALYHLSAYVYPAVWSFYGKAQFGWGPWLIGISLAAFGVGMALVQGVLVGPSIRRLGVWRVAIFGLLLEVVTFVFYGLATSSFWVLAYTPVAALAGIGGPALQQILSNAARDDQQGELQGVLAAVAAVATGIAPLAMTGIFAVFTAPTARLHLPGAPFLVAGVLMALAVWLLMRARPRAAFSG